MILTYEQRRNWFCERFQQSHRYITASRQQTLLPTGKLPFTGFISVMQSFRGIAAADGVDREIVWVVDGESIDLNDEGCRRLENISKLRSRISSLKILSPDAYQWVASNGKVIIAGHSDFAEAETFDRYNGVITETSGLRSLHHFIPIGTNGLSDICDMNTECFPTADDLCARRETLTIPEFLENW